MSTSHIGLSLHCETAVGAPIKQSSRKMMAFPDRFRLVIEATRRADPTAPTHVTPRRVRGPKETQLMKFNVLKKKAALITAIALLLITLAGFATATQPIEGEPRYTLDEVIDACEAAYDTDAGIAQCITNVCGFYGCEGW